jgi:hypothetical protein
MAGAWLFAGTAVYAAGNGGDAARHASTNTFQQIIGGASFEAASQVAALREGGYLVVGRTASHGEGDTDVHVCKLSELGEIIWEKRFGEEESEEANDVIQTPDGNYLIVGSADNYDNPTGLRDVLVIKSSPDGNVIWKRTYGLPESINSGNAVTATPDGNYVIVGNSLSIVEDATSNVYIVKINDAGEVLWENHYGGPEHEEAKDITATAEGLAIVGSSESYTSGRWDIWLLRTDTDGNELAHHSFGGKDNEMGNAVIATQDGGLLIGGYSYSFSAGSLDAWVVKVDRNGQEAWSKNFGGLSTDEAFSLVELADGSFVMAGYTEVYVPNADFENTSAEGYNVLLVKLDLKGNKLWERSIGGDHNQKAFAMAKANEGDGLVVVGSTDQGSSSDALVLKLDASGQLN